MNGIRVTPYILSPAILVLGRFGELFAVFGESIEYGILFGGRGVVHLLRFVFSLVDNLDCVCSLVTVDWPAAIIFEIAAKSIRAAETLVFILPKLHTKSKPNKQN